MRNKLFILIAAFFCCLGASAQENQKSLRTNNDAEKSQVTIQPVTLPSMMGMSPITDFYATYKIQKQLKVSPDATKINWSSPYLVKWDGVGIRGIGSDRGLYLGHAAGFAIEGSKGGLMLGVQRGYNPLTGQWELMPMATPYINVGGMPIGFDVGGMAYSLLREAAIRNGNSGNGNPNSGIIPPPIDWKVGFDGAPEIPAWMEKQFENQ